MQKQKIYDIRELGAVGDGSADDTEAIQNAIDLCSSEGGGKVFCPAGIYSIRPLVLRSDVNLHLEENALLRGSANPEHYSDWKSRNINPEHVPYNSRYLIVAENERDISITGRGAINGQGPAHYDTLNKDGLFWPIKDKATRPGRMIWFIHCKNIQIEEVAFAESPAWTFWMMGCENVTFHKVTIKTPYEEINADGIDIDSCRNVHISHCDIKTGDDCIVLRSINRALKEKRFCEQVTVENCTLESNCNAIRISYVRDGTIRNARFSNISISNSRRGIICQIPTPKVLLADAETDFLDHPNQNGISVPVVENIRFQNISIKALQPIWFYMEDEAVAYRVANIRFENLSLEGSTASVLKGNKEAHLENISLHNIKLVIRNEKTFWGSSADLTETALGFEVAYCRNLQVSNCIVEGQNEAKSEESPVFYIQRSSEIYINQLINRTPNPDTN
jgi:pectate lyase